jgi:hypothetical protein
VESTPLPDPAAAPNAPDRREKKTQYDVDGSGQIEFPEFIEMFRDSVLDLAQINAWVTEREGTTLIRESIEDLGLLEVGARGGGKGGGDCCRAGRG